MLCQWKNHIATNTALEQNLNQFHKKPRYLSTGSIRNIDAKKFLLIAISTLSFFQVE